MKLPQLSLRELFLLVALVAMGCGWWVERTKLTAEVDRLKEHDIFWPSGPGDRLEVSIDEHGAETIAFETQDIPIPQFIELPAPGVDLIDGVEKKARP